MGGLDETELRMIAAGNAARLFRHPLPERRLETGLKGCRWRGGAAVETGRAGYSGRAKSGWRLKEWTC